MIGHLNNLPPDTMKIFVLVMLLTWVVYGSELDSADLDAKKQYYQKLFIVQPGSVTGTAQLNYELTQQGENIECQLANAMELNDNEINRILVEYLFWKTAPLRADIQYVKPGQDQLEKFRSIDKLKPFLLECLNNKKPHRKIFQPIAVIFKDDKQVIDSLVAIGQRDDWMLANAMDAFLSAGICNESVDELVLNAISSKYATLSSVAALYLKQRPLPSALPYLIQQLRRPDADVDFSLAMSMAEHVFVESAYVNKIPAVFTKDRMAQYVDGWRAVIVGAILGYDKAKVSQYSEDIITAKDQASFGPASKGQYDTLVD